MNDSHSTEDSSPPSKAAHASESQQAPTVPGQLGAAMDVRFAETVDAFCDYVTALGFDHVELKREYLHGHPDAPSTERGAELRESYEVSVTYHAPFRDWNAGSFNDASRAAAVDQVCATLDDAATAGAGAVVVHGGSVPRRYPDHVREKAQGAAVRSLVECSVHAADVGVPRCLENQPASESTVRYTTTPGDLENMLASVEERAEAAADGAADYLDVTLDVGHAKVNGVAWRAFADRFGDRVRVLHLSENDGLTDSHDPIRAFTPICEAVGAPYNVLEMKSVDDVARCLEPTP